MRLGDFMLVDTTQSQRWFSLSWYSSQWGGGNGYLHLTSIDTINKTLDGLYQYDHEGVANTYYGMLPIDQHASISFSGVPYQ